MKRLLLLLLALVLAAGAVPAVRAEKAAEILSYDFEFRFHMEPQDYPYSVREHMRGYEELADALELKGNASWCPETDSIDIRAELVPVSNPASAISVRLFGTTVRMCIESPLLGPEPYYLTNMYRIMFFLQELWKQTGLPLQSLLLLNPGTTSFFLRNEVVVWTKTVPKLTDGLVITAEELEKICETWRRQLDEDRFFQVWMSAFYGMAADSETISEQLETLPDVLLEAAGGEDLTVVEKDGALHCVNAKGETVFTEQSGEKTYFFSLTPPEIMVEYLPEFLYSESSEGGTRNLKLQASWERTEPDPEAWGDDVMLKFSLDAAGIPESWPTDTEITADITAGGFVLPDIDWKIRVKISEAGEIELAVSEPDRKGKAGNLLFSSTGTVTPAAYDGELAYTLEDMKKCPYILITNHTFISELLPQIVPYFAGGVIDFVYELPVRACQSIMDDLEEYGLLIHLAEGLKH